MAEAWVDLYEHSRFAGRRLSLLGPSGTSIPHYGNISVQGAAFEDLVSSARFQLPAGRSYRLYQDRRYKGSYIELTGTGRVMEIRDMKARPYQFGDKLSSSRYV